VTALSSGLFPVPDLECGANALEAITMAEPFQPRRRPVWVWVISAYYILSLLWGWLAFYVVLSGSIPMTPEAKAYVEGLTSIDYAMTAIQGLISLSAAVSLFLLRKEAYYLFWLSLVTLISMTLWHVFGRQWLSAMESMKGATAGGISGLVILIAVCLYVTRLRKSGKLT
jgi:hypothetical protein